MVNQHCKRTLPVEVRNPTISVSPVRLWSLLPNVLLTTFVYASFWGWQAVLNQFKVSRRRHSPHLKWLPNSTLVRGDSFWSSMKARTISRKNNRVTWQASDDFLKAMKWAIFESLSTTSPSLNQLSIVFFKAMKWCVWSGGLLTYSTTLNMSLDISPHMRPKELVFNQHQYFVSALVGSQASRIMHRMLSKGVFGDVQLMSLE